MRTVTWGLIALCATAGIYVLTLSPIGGVVERWETSNGVVKIRVDQRAEDLWFFGLPGAYYVFQSSPKESPDTWREVMTHRRDDPGPIPRQSVHFVNKNIAFIFIDWMYAVTVDGGSNWAIWSARDDLPKWECCDYRVIKDVTIASDGTGTMALEGLRDGQSEVRALKTRDFGRHWTQE